ncbi:hypothetical protein [Streptomyces sp. NPDC007083]|uniref:hypothetical protein n=1 Tax=unclassified Streptomyces TaxID=2593676 RepID=UPI0033E0475C
MTASGPRPVPDPRSRPGLPEHVRECVLLKHGEVFLRGRNRARFEEQLYDTWATRSVRSPGRSGWRRAAASRLWAARSRWTGSWTGCAG